jgi:hypothetical protein
MEITKKKVFIIQQNNSVYFCGSNMLAAYNYLVSNINIADSKLIKCYKQYTIDFKKTDTIFIPSISGQSFTFKRLEVFVAYNTGHSKSKIKKS